MINFFIDLIYVLAGLAAVISYKYGGDAKLLKVATAYAFIAILFQFFAHILEQCFDKIQSLNKYEYINSIAVIIISIILALAITQLLIPIQSPL